MLKITAQFVLKITLNVTPFRGKKFDNSKLLELKSKNRQFNTKRNDVFALTSHFSRNLAYLLNKHPLRAVQERNRIYSHYYKSVDDSETDISG